MHLTLAISYSGRQDIAAAAQRIAELVAEGKLSPSEVGWLRGCGVGFEVQRTEALLFLWNFNLQGQQYRQSERIAGMGQEMGRGMELPPHTF